MKKRSIKNDILILLLDIIAVNLAYYLALVLRGKIEAVPAYFSLFYRIAPWYTLACIAVFYLFRLYGGMWKYAGLGDMNRIIGANIVTILIQIGISVLAMKTSSFSLVRMPVTYYSLGAVFQLVFVTAIRFAHRIVAMEKSRRGKKNGTALVIGVGDLGRQTVEALQAGENYRVGCIADPKNEHVGLKMDGIPVYGLDELAKTLEKHRVNCVFLADPGLKDDEKRKIQRACTEKEVELKVWQNNAVEVENKVSELEFVPAAEVTETWAKDYKEKYGEEPSFF